jgi:type I restriction enzyme S subunit
MKKGWEQRRIGDVCDVVNGGTPKTGVSEYWDGQHLWITPAEMGKRASAYVSDTERKLTDAGLRDSSARLVPPFSVILSSRAPIGHLVINTRPMATNQGCKSLIPRRDVEHKYLYFYLSSIVDFLNSLGTGATFRELSAGKLKDVSIPVPPLPEQQRIVGILDEAFAGLATAEANAARNLQNAREIFDSHLHAVFSQRGEVLQEGGPEAAATTKGWVRRRLAELTTKIGSGATPQGGEANYKRSGISLIRSLNVHDCEFRLKDLAFIDETQARQLDNVSVEPWDVLLNITGASVARCCIVPNDLLPARVNQHVSILRPIAHELSPQFLQYLLVSGDYKNRLLTAGDGGATRQALTKSQLQDFEIEIPPLPEQRRIVEELNDLRRQAAKLDKVARQKQSALAELKKSLLHTAFNGDL